MPGTVLFLAFPAALNSRGMQTEAARRKQRLRRALRDRRRAISDEHAGHAAVRAAERLADDALWATAQSIALYLPNDGEFPTHEIAHRARGDGKTLYLPCVNDGAMVMRRWDADGLFARNRYGIEEPDETAPVAAAIDIILLPVVGWSASGFRLGMGGGYYDRLLGGRDMGGWRVGLAYDCQRLDALDELREAWDVPLEAVLTESALHVSANTAYASAGLNDPGLQG